MWTLLGKPSQPGIADPHEIETVRRRRRRSPPALLRLERRENGGASAARFGGADHGRYDAAHHSVQEAIRLDIEAEDARGDAPGRARHAAARRALVAAPSRESREIVLAEERLPGLVQLANASPEPARPDVPPQDRGRRRHDQEAIRAAHRAKASVESSESGGRLPQANVLRQTRGL